MTDIVVDSSVVAKWVVPEPDSPLAQRMAADTHAAGGRLIVLDLVFPEVVNVIWKKHRQKLVTLEQAKVFLDDLKNATLHIEPAARLLDQALDIAVKYDRAVYDALFVALAVEMGAGGVTADEPLYNTTHVDFPQIVLLRNWPSP